MDEEKVLNEEALDFLDEAMFTSSLISDKERQNGRVEDVDDIYPRTKAEAEYMDEMLNRAEQVAEDRNDEKYNERYCMLREIVDWSLKRHSTWKWSLICGALLGAETPFDKCPDQHANDAWTLRLSTAEKYKMYTLIDYKQRTESSLREVSEYKQKADTAKLEENKEKYLKQVKYYEESAAKNRAKYDSINAMDFAQVHEMAKADLARRVDSEVSHGNTLRNYMIYLLILIPLYIITGYPHGYSITRHRRRSGCMNIFQKIGFGIASFCFGTGLAMSLLPDYKVKTTYTDGSTSTHTESDVGLMIAGAFIFCFVSSVIMTVETAYGLFENFNWSGWFKKIKPAPKESATAMAQQNTEA